MLHWLESLRGKGCILGEGHHKWWIVDLWVRHWAEITKQRMETSEFSKTKESMEKQIENQSHVDCLLQLTELCTVNMYLRVKLSTRFLHGAFEASEGSCMSCVAKFARGKQLDPSPGQCPLTHCLDCAWVFGVQFNHCNGPLTGFSFVQFFLVSKVQVGAAWMTSGGRGNDYSRIDNVAQRLEGRRLSRVLQPMET
jgi:hypothetical protein